jgi:hypothetical protein
LKRPKLILSLTIRWSKRQEARIDGESLAANIQVKGWYLSDTRRGEHVSVVEAVSTAGYGLVHPLERYIIQQNQSGASINNCTVVTGTIQNGGVDCVCWRRDLLETIGLADWSVPRLTIASLPEHSAVNEAKREVGRVVDIGVMGIGIRAHFASEDFAVGRDVGL